MKARRGSPGAGLRPIRRLLVANRGEIALRVIRAARELEVPSVAVVVGADRELPYAEAADLAIELPEPSGAEAAEPYLDAAALVDAALRAGADAVHPGYGFLAENAGFARACAEAGLVFVGPSPEALELTGDKVAARRQAAGAGVPVLEGQGLEPGASPRAIALAGDAVGFPLLIKATSGGGGRGIRRVERPDTLVQEVGAASREAGAAFGDGRVYLERELSAPRHVEVQLLADASGGVALFPERDCSIQRRHQKLIEESPSPAVGPELRGRLLEAAARVARASSYRNAGTVEFLLDAEGRFYFIEVNARLQVEHPVTEMVAGTDLVAWQLRIAAGEPIPEPLAGPRVPSGHAIECRICAERPPAFTPSAGRLLLWQPPAGPGVRFDAGYRAGNTVGTRYDSLLGKLITWGPDRRAALGRAERALAEMAVLGVDTTCDFLAACIRHPDFRAGRADARFIERDMAGWSPPEPPPEALLIAAEARARRGQGAASAAGAPRAHPGPWEAVRGLRP